MQRAFGLHLAIVQPQNEPLKLELSGRTAYDPDTLFKVRPRFDALVLKVYVTRGQQVKKGDSLVDLYSTDLASAKSDFQTKFVQWQHDRKLYDLREKLVQTGAISQQLWVDTQNDEQKSHLDYNLALDKLQVYEVPEEEIAPLIARLKDKGKEIDAAQFGDVSEKAKMTLRAKTDGIVIERAVVPGNFYETGSELMVIAPLDHLWVLANVFELDQDKVQVGQTMEIQFPFLEQKIKGQVQYVANEVSKDTRAVQVRATIPNPDGRLKSDMLVKAILDIPPQPGQTVIPRLSMVAINGEGYVFVHKPPQPARRSRQVRAAEDRGGAGANRPRGRQERPEAGRGGRDQRQPDPGAALRRSADRRYRPARSMTTRRNPSRRAPPRRPAEQGHRGRSAQPFHALSCKGFDPPPREVYDRRDESVAIARLAAERSLPGSRSPLACSLPGPGPGKGSRHALVRGGNHVTYHDCVRRRTRRPRGPSPTTITRASR